MTDEVKLIWAFSVDAISVPNKNRVGGKRNMAKQFSNFLPALRFT